MELVHQFSCVVFQRFLLFLLQMLLSLLQVLLPLLMISPRAASSPPTFTVTDPMTGAALVCDHCPPGTYMRVRCTSTRKSECAACPTGSFTELWNYIGKCLRCGVCDLNQVEKKACAADSDCQCECKQGFYYERKYDTCLPHSACPVGRGVLRQGESCRESSGNDKCVFPESPRAFTHEVP